MANLLRWSAGMALPKKKEENNVFQTSTPLISSLKTMSPTINNRISSVSRPSNSFSSTNNALNNSLMRTQQINERIRQQAEQRRQQELQRQRQEEQQRQQRLAEQQRQQEQRRQQEQAKKLAQQRQQEQKQRNLLNSAGLGNFGLNTDIRSNIETQRKLRQQAQERAAAKKQAEEAKNPWKKYYDEEKQKVRDQAFKNNWGESTLQDIFNAGWDSRLAETNAKNRYASELLNQGQTEKAKKAANEAVNTARQNSAIEHAKGKALGATYDSEIKDNPFLATFNAIRSADIGNAMVGGAEGGLADVAKFLINTGQYAIPYYGWASGIMRGAPSATEAIVGRGLDDKTGDYKDLSLLERLGRGVSGGIDIVGPKLNASEKLAGAIMNVLKGGAKNVANQGGKAALMELLKNALGEGIEEGVQEIGDYFGEGNTLTDENGNISGEKIGEMAGRAGQAAGLGALGGGLMSGANIAINKTANAINTRRNANVDTNVDTNIDTNIAEAEVVNNDTNVNEETNIDPARVQTTQDGTMVKTNADGSATRLSDNELANVVEQSSYQPAKALGTNPFIDNSVKLTSGTEDINTLLERANNGDESAKQKLAEILQQSLQENQKSDWRGKSVEEVINQKPQSLTESAKQYGINDSDGKIQDIQNMLGRQNIIAKYDADVFKGSNENAMWRIYKDENGNTVREVVFNPNAKGDAIVQELAVHELAHDIFAKNTKTSEQLYQNVKQWLENDSEYQKQLNDLKNTYGDVDVEEEAVAKALQSKFGNQEEINRLVNYEPTVARKIYDWVVDKLNKVTGGRIEKLYWTDIKNKFERAYSESGNYSTNEETMFAKKTTSDGTRYVELDGKLFRNEDGTQKTPRKAYEALVGKILTLDDGSEVKIVKKLPGNKDLYNELIKRYPRSKGVSDIKSLNNKINGNIDEALEQSDFIINKGDVDGRHSKNDIVSFDTREVNLYDGNKAYTMTLSIAERNNGDKVGYAKKFIRPNKDLTQKIKKEAPLSSTTNKVGWSSRSMPLSDSIPQGTNNVNTKMSISDSSPDGTLLALHNLSEDKLRGVLDLGGFPVPSIAITNPDIFSHSSYGDISAVFNKKAIDPINSKNEVYDRDVYSPRFPVVDYEKNYSGSDSAARNVGMDSLRFDNILENSNSPSDLVDALLNRDEVVDKYVADNNLNYDKSLSGYEETKAKRKVAEDNGIRKYLNNQVSTLFGKKGIRNNKDPFTASGNRRTFNQLHDEYTLDNIVSNLTKKGTKNNESNYNTPSSISASLANRIRSIDQMHDGENKIQTTENYLKAKEPFIKKIENVIDKLSEYRKYKSDYGDYTIDVLAEFTSGPLTESRLKRVLSENNYDVDRISDSMVKEIINNLNDVKNNAPVAYFESKPQRAVGFDEIETLVVPDNISGDIKQRLADNGIKYIEYDHNNENDRQNILKSLNQYKFDKTSDFDDYVDKRANVGRSYDTEVDTLPEDFNVKHYVTDQVEAQNKRSKVPLRERIADTTAELKHYLVDDAVAYERYIKDKNERLNIREGVDRVRSSDMIARQYMMDNGLGEVVKMSDADLNEFQQYLIAKRALEVAEQGKATGRSKAADQALIDSVGDKYAKQEQIIRDYTRGMLEYSADNGLISQKLKDDLIENNPNYVPMNRVFDVLEKKTGFKSKQLGNLSKQSVVQKMTGSERVVENPIESLMANTLRMVNEVERNNTAKLIAKSNAFHEKTLAEGEKPRPGYDTLNYMVDGKKVSYEVPELVAQEMKNLNSVLPKSIEIPTRFFGTPTRWLRSGATQNNPIFAVSNLLRDQMQTVVTGKVSSNLKGTKDALVATFSPTKRGKDLRAELNRAGIIGSEYRQTYGYKSGDLMAQLQADNNVSKAAMNKLKHPIDAIGDLIGRTEYFTRAQQYFGTDGDATTKAQAARNNTLNFNRAGSITRVLNRVIPFLNAGVQGGRITVNSFKNRPVHTTLAIAGLTGIALAAKGAAEAQDKELWDRIDDSDKGQNIIIFTPNAHYDSDTNRVEGIIKIPVAQMLYPVMDATNNVKGDPSDLTMLAGDIFTATTGIEAPTEEKGFLPVVNQLMPTAFKPIIETSFNKNLFTGGEIVKDYEKNMNPEDKSAKYTSGLARTIAKATGIDAPDVDNFIQNWGGGLAKDLSKVMTDNPDNVKDGGGVGKMFENGFNRRFLSGTVESQYEIAEGLAKNYKNEVKSSDVFKSLDSDQQQKVLNAIDKDMKDIANVSTNVEQGKANDKTSLTKRQTEIVANGFDIDSYINSVIDKKATYTGSGNKSVGKTLTGNILDYGKTAVRNNAIDANDSISNDSKSILNKYNSMTSDDWNKYLYGTSAEAAAAEYNLALAKYENDTANGDLNEAQKIKREKELAKLYVSQKWTKSYRDAYSLAGTKADMQAYLNTLDDSTRAETVSILNGLNNAMYEAGIIQASTYKTRYNAINNTTSRSSSRKSSKSSTTSDSEENKGISSAEASAIASLAKTMSKADDNVKVKTPEAPTTKRKMSRTKSSGNSTGLKTYTPSLAKNVTVTKGANRSIV